MSWTSLGWGKSSSKQKARVRKKKDTSRSRRRTSSAPVLCGTDGLDNTNILNMAVDEMPPKKARRVDLTTVQEDDIQSTADAGQVSRRRAVSVPHNFTSFLNFGGKENVSPAQIFTAFSPEQAKCPPNLDSPMG